MSHITRIISEHPKLDYVILNYDKIDDRGVAALLEGNDEALNKRLNSIRIDLQCNFIAETGLKMAKGKLSPSSILSIARTNFYIKDKNIIEKTEQEARMALHAYEPSSAAEDLKKLKIDEEAKAQEEKQQPSSPVTNGAQFIKR